MSDNNTDESNMTEQDTNANDSVFAESTLDESPEQIVDLLEQQVAEFRERELKAQAELENFRKRLLRDTELQIKYSLVPFARDLLEIVDNLNRATDSAANNPAAESLISGVKLVQNQLATVLSKYDCKPIEAIGKTFDPNFHQAITQQPSDVYPAGTVSFETSVGYMMHDRVIRPSLVIVSTGPAANS